MRLPPVVPLHRGSEIFVGEYEVVQSSIVVGWVWVWITGNVTQETWVVADPEFTPPGSQSFVSVTFHLIDPIPDYASEDSFLAACRSRAAPNAVLWYWTHRVDPANMVPDPF